MTLSDLEVFKLSAEACGQLVHTHFANEKLWIHYANGSIEEWNPFLNADQRWECVQKLLEMGYCVRIGFANDDYHQLEGEPEINCPAEEFPARALAQLHKGG